MAPIEPSTLIGALAGLPALGRRRVLGVWLFGSEARGEAQPGSDVDIGILADPPLGLDRMVVMDELGTALDRDVDVIDLGGASATLVWEVLTSGRLIHETDELAVERFLRRARYAAEDAEQRNRMIVLAQTGHLGDRER